MKTKTCIYLQATQHPVIRNIIFIHCLQSKEAFMERIEVVKTMEKYGKRRVVHYRVPEVVWDRLKQVAELFNLSPGQYAKAVLYLNLNMLNVLLDRRRRTWKRKIRRKLEE